MNKYVIFTGSQSKVQLIKINLSTPVLTKSRCRKCGKHPDVYYHIQQPSHIFDPRTKADQLLWLKKHIQRLSVDWILIESPKYVRGLLSLSHSPAYKNYDPVLHRTKKEPTDNYVEYLSCECGGSSWAWGDIGNQTIEHRQRRSLRTHPKTFRY
jgi:hypothetical protein